MSGLMNAQVPLWVVIAYMVYACAVQALPRPSEASKPVYVFLYSFFHLLSLNLALVFDPMKKLPERTQTVVVTQVRSDTAVPPAPATPEEIEKLSEMAQLPPVADHHDKQ